MNLVVFVTQKRAPAMKTRPATRGEEAFSLSLVLIFSGVLFLLLTGLLAWTTTNGNLAQRYNEYYDTAAAAEAATEKVAASMASDFQSSGASGVDANLSSYSASVPTPHPRRLIRRGHSRLMTRRRPTRWPGSRPTRWRSDADGK